MQQAGLKRLQERVVAMLGPEEENEWREAIAQADAEGNFFIAQPFHRAVGTKE